jgi:hypothetical protein
MSDLIFNLRKEDICSDNKRTVTKLIPSGVICTASNILKAFQMRIVHLIKKDTRLGLK